MKSFSIATLCAFAALSVASAGHVNPPGPVGGVNPPGPAGGVGTGPDVLSGPNPVTANQVVDQIQANNAQPIGHPAAKAKAAQTYSNNNAQLVGLRARTQFDANHDESFADASQNARDTFKANHGQTMGHMRRHARRQVRQNTDVNPMQERVQNYQDNNSQGAARRQVRREVRRNTDVNPMQERAQNYQDNNSQGSARRQVRRDVRRNTDVNPIEDRTQNYQDDNIHGSARRHARQHARDQGYHPAEARYDARTN